MKLNNLITGAVAAAIALTIGSTSLAAQGTGTDTTRRTTTTRTKARTARSTTRIRVSKEQTSKGEVTPAPTPAPAVNQDSINAANAERARQDSIANAERMRQDSIAAAERARQDSIARAEQARRDSIARADSIAAAEALARRLRQIGGFYWGLAAGVATPTSGLDVAEKKNLALDLPFGWDPIGSPLGIRFDLGYNMLSAQNEFWNVSEPPRAQIMHGSADLKLRLPVVQRYMKRASVYGVAGGTYFRYKDLYLADNSGNRVLPTDSWTGKAGWNAGGGVQFGWGRSNVFVEARYMRFSNGGVSAGHVPIVLGLTWF